MNVSSFKRVLASAGMDAATLPCSHAELFDLLDADHSGGVDSRELLCGLSFVLAPLASDSARLELAFLAFDAREAGALSPADLSEMLKHFTLLVARNSSGGGDGGGDDPLVRQRRVAERADAVFHALDADGDGRITLQEFLGGVRADPELARALLGERGGGDAAEEAAAAGEVAAQAARRRRAT